MKSTVRVLITITMLLIAAHRLPAPILEVPESPSPTPNLTPSPPPAIARPTIATVRTTPSAPGPVRFGGTWTGKIKEAKFGDLDMTVVINPDGTSLKVSSRHGTAVRPTTVNGNTLSWTGGIKNDVFWTLTPNADGQTASVTRKWTNQFTSATFRCVGAGQSPAGSPGATKQHPRKQRKQALGY
jgi:hypothetical protein